MVDKLIDYLEKYKALSTEEKDYLVKNIEIRELKANQLLLSEGEVSSEFYFIIKGAIRLYYTKELDEKSAYFYFENMFVSSYESFTKNKPSKQNLITIDDTVVAVITNKNAQELLTRFPEFEFLARVIMEEELIIYQEIISNFVSMNAELRYRKLIETDSQILQRVPQYQLSSYLGVAPETLSRIRKKIK
ncbi:MAG: Crp/Fnr family transcriptional regulator [Chlorobiota bacterium]